mmetsp:Transcript_24797/g.55664  ORF Transcript_24797/g.55664 Transcript_24797/m.55664 type:complete len:217 (+) Transcript_24797:102-752(+)
MPLSPTHTLSCSLSASLSGLYLKKAAHTPHANAASAPVGSKHQPAYSCWVWNSHPPGEKEEICSHHHRSADPTGQIRRVHPLVPLHSCPLNPIKWSARRAADRRPLCLPLPSPLQVALSSVGGRGAPAAPGRGDELEQSQDAIRIERLRKHIVGPAADEEVLVILHHVARHANDEAGAALLPQLFRGTGAVEHRHLVVHEDDTGWRVLCAHIGVHV